MKARSSRSTASKYAANLRATASVARFRFPFSGTLSYTSASSGLQRGASLAASISTGCRCLWRLPRDFTTGNHDPPFGAVRHGGEAPRYSGPEFEYKIIDIAGHLAAYGAFIVQQMSAPFRLSGAQYYQRNDHVKYQRLVEQTGIQLEAGCGIDTTFHREGWKHGAPVTEIVCAEFTPPVNAQGELFNLMTGKVVA